MAIGLSLWSSTDLKRWQMYLTDLGENRISMFSDFCHVVRKPIYFAVRFHYLSMLMHSENFKFAFVKIYKYVNFITSAIFQTYQFFIIV